MYGRATICTSILSLTLLGACGDGAGPPAPIGAKSPEPVVKIANNILFRSVERDRKSVVPSNAPDAAAITLSGPESSNVTISIPETVVVGRLPWGGAALAAIIDRGNMRSNTMNRQNAASIIDASSGSATASFSADASGDGIIDGRGQLYLWIGGSVTGRAGQEEGAYGGLVDVTTSP